ncbi:hypothetical protein EG329_004495 [Mollisiaceae sp. DMI_Dod_QoI]|nr:hypothetical protein EG329_004495 [Helotiales sp. DMI_Dod_QoI]
MAEEVSNGHQVDSVQFNSTESGRLSDRRVIVMAGFPSRAKTYMAVAITRYLRWLGINVQVFRLVDYSTAAVGYRNKELPDDYFLLNALPSSMLLRQQITKKCLEDMLHFFKHENGQVAVYDTFYTNSIDRRSLLKELEMYQLEAVFIEPSQTDEQTIQEVSRGLNLTTNSVGWSAGDALKDFLCQIPSRIPRLEVMEEPELQWIKIINGGEKLRNCK